YTPSPAGHARPGLLPMKHAGPRRVAGLIVPALVALLRSWPAVGYAEPFSQAPALQVAGELAVVIKSQHRRMPFAQDIQRIAVGDTEILSAELITSREVLVLGRETGRTTLIVWFANGSSREYLFSVERDLSLLERALKLVNPTI